MGEKEPQATRSNGILEESFIDCFNRERGNEYPFGSFGGFAMAEAWPTGLLCNEAILDENEMCRHVRQRFVRAKGREIVASSFTTPSRM